MHDEGFVLVALNADFLFCGRSPFDDDEKVLDGAVDAYDVCTMVAMLVGWRFPMRRPSYVSPSVPCVASPPPGTIASSSL